MDESLTLACPHCHTLNRVPTARLGENPSCGRCKQRLFTGAPLDLDASGFARHVKDSALPVLVDFWAPWCGPCLAMAPAFAEAARTLEPSVRLAKVNTEAHPDLAAPFGIRAIPTLVLLRQGREVGRLSGAQPAGRIVTWVRQMLAGG
ncbi:MAG TPA: thioredoxin TrxC [Xanthomonadaceae bacterium]|nr:thioredoxin TrxC [Xanthomonadaceae bacterium]